MIHVSDCTKTNWRYQRGVTRSHKEKKKDKKTNNGQKKRDKRWKMVEKHYTEN
jgi:hypothetical protein